MHSKCTSLSIPNLRQPPESTTCGPYCVSMIADALSLDVPIEKIEQVCGQTDGGTIETSLALGLLELGLKATIYVPIDGDSIPYNYSTKSSTFIRKSLRQRARHVEDPIEQQAFVEMAELVGKEAVSFTLPTRKVIEQEIDRGRAWILGVSMIPLYLERIEKDIEAFMHFIIVQGYTDDEFEINDPSHEYGGIYSVDKDQLLYALYSVDGLSICVEMDNVETAI